MIKRVNILYLQLFITLVLVSGIFSDVNAQDNSDRWVAIEKNATEEYYYDSLTVSREGDSVIVWIKTIYKEKIYDEDEKLMVSAVNALYLYCGKNKYTMQDVEVTYKDGTKKNVDYQEKNKSIKPESPIEKVYNIFCRAEK